MIAVHRELIEAAEHRPVAEVCGCADDLSDLFLLDEFQRLLDLGLGQQ